MAAGDNMFIDATERGNAARYANHSCNPNCVAEQWIVDREPRIVFRALKNIPVGKPICIDYKVAPVEEVLEITQEFFELKKSCRCGEAKCKWSKAKIERVGRQDRIIR